MALIINKKTATALERSIEKWQKIVAAFKADNDNPDYEWPTKDNCPLCAIFHPDLKPKSINDGTCDGCPIALTSGSDACVATPYVSFVRHYTDGPAAGLDAKRMVDYMQWILDQAQVRYGGKNRVA